MTAEPTGLFQGLAPLLVNRTVIMTVAADGKGLLTFNNPEKSKRRRKRRADHGLVHHGES